MSVSLKNTLAALAQAMDLNQRAKPVFGKPVFEHEAQSSVFSKRTHQKRNLPSYNIDMYIQYVLSYCRLWF